jgi:3-oxoacyl-[acyl-carrier protein] reductase
VDVADASAAEFDGRIAVVTGASLGIGAAVVQRLSAGRAHVGFCARDASAVEALVDACAKQPGTVRGYLADMGDSAQTDAFLGAVEGELGTPNILVNNVGQAPSRNFLYMSDDDWTALFEVNLMAAVRCTRRVLPAMRRQRWGRVVMIGTGSAKYPNAATIDYAASKAALVATGKALARKYAADNVLVNSVLPGLIRTPMWERTAAELAEASGSDVEAVFAARSANVPLGRYGTAEEVAELVAFLCSERATYLTGTAIDIDGGLGTHVF